MAGQAQPRRNPWTPDLALLQLESRLTQPGSSLPSRPIKNAVEAIANTVVAPLIRGLADAGVGLPTLVAVRYNLRVIADCKGVLAGRNQLKVILPCVLGVKSMTLNPAKQGLWASFGMQPTQLWVQRHQAANPSTTDDEMLAQAYLSLLAKVIEDACAKHANPASIPWQDMINTLNRELNLQGQQILDLAIASMLNVLKAYWETSHPGLELATELSKTRPVEKQLQSIHAWCERAMRALPPPLCQVFTTPPLDPESLEARHALFYKYYQIQVKDPAQQQQAAPTAAAPGAGRTMRGQENRPHAGQARPEAQAARRPSNRVPPVTNYSDTSDENDDPMTDSPEPLDDPPHNMDAAHPHNTAARPLKPHNADGVRAHNAGGLPSRAAGAQAHTTGGPHPPHNTERGQERPGRAPHREHVAVQGRRRLRRRASSPPIAIVDSDDLIDSEIDEDRYGDLEDRSEEPEDRLQEGGQTDGYPSGASAGAEGRRASDGRRRRGGAPRALPAAQPPPEAVAYRVAADGTFVVEGADDSDTAQQPSHDSPGAAPHARHEHPNHSRQRRTHDQRGPARGVPRAPDEEVGADGVVHVVLSPAAAVNRTGHRTTVGTAKHVPHKQRHTAAGQQPWPMAGSMHGNEGADGLSHEGSEGAYECESGGYVTDDESPNGPLHGARGTVSNAPDEAPGRVAQRHRSTRSGPAAAAGAGVRARCGPAGAAGHTAADAGHDGDMAPTSLQRGRSEGARSAVKGGRAKRSGSGGRVARGGGKRYAYGYDLSDDSGDEDYECGSECDMMSECESSEDLEPETQVPELPHRSRVDPHQRGAAPRMPGPREPVPAVRLLVPRVQLRAPQAPHQARYDRQSSDDEEGLYGDDMKENEPVPKRACEWNAPEQQPLPELREVNGTKPLNTHAADRPHHTGHPVLQPIAKQQQQQELQNVLRAHRE